MANQRKRSDDETIGTGSEMGPEDAAEPREGGAKVPGDADRFEDQLENLEDIVTRIDSGELSLEESIEAFERGVGLVRSLNRKLDEVERRVDVLMRNASGELQATPYEGEAGVADNGGATKKSDDDDIPF
jgi:exodeoxyribonuclease VII small subunit